MATLTLEQIKESVQQKYAPLIVPFGDGQEIRLRSALMLSKDERAALVALQSDKKDDEDYNEDATLEQLRDLIRCVANDRERADAFLAAIAAEEYELALLSEVLRLYGEQTQQGEASASQS